MSPTSTPRTPSERFFQLTLDFSGTSFDSFRQTIREIEEWYQENRELAFAIPGGTGFKMRMNLHGEALALIFKMQWPEIVTAVVEVDNLQSVYRREHANRDTF